MGDSETAVSMNIDLAKEVTTGFMSDSELEWLAMQALGHQRIAEIGSWTGRSTLALAMNTKGVVWAVDTWLGAHGDLDDIVAIKGKEWAFNQFRHNLRFCPNVYVKRMTSLSASVQFEPASLDFVFIDAAHDYASVANDIKAWSPLLIRGGLLCGHDYCDSRWPGVRQAVDELVPERRLMDPNNGERSLWWTNV